MSSDTFPVAGSNKKSAHQQQQCWLLEMPVVGILIGSWTVGMPAGNANTIQEALGSGQIIWAALAGRLEEPTAWKSCHACQDRVSESFSVVAEVRNFEFRIQLLLSLFEVLWTWLVSSCLVWPPSANQTLFACCCGMWWNIGWSCPPPSCSLVSITCCLIWESKKVARMYSFFHKEANL